MKISNPVYRSRMNIPRKARVLEVGSGHNPTYRSNVLAEKFLDSNYHRSDNVKVFPHQTLVNAAGEHLPFKDHEFDYVICCQVMEHVDNPEAFVRELARVGRRGYIEVPSMVGEALGPKESHRWLSLEIDGKIVMYDKGLLPPLFPNFGRAFINFLPYDHLGLRLFFMIRHQANTVRYQWKDSIEVLVNPQDEYYRSFFTQPWTNEMVRKIFPVLPAGRHLGLTLQSLWCLVSDALTRLLHPRRAPLSLDDYFRLKKTSE